MTPEELAELNGMANEFNYIGEGLEHNYIGQGEEFQFGGGQSSFAGEQRTGMDYGFKINNPTAEDVDIALCPAFFKDLASLQEYGFSSVKGILKDGVIATINAKDVTATALDQTKKLIGFNAFVQNNPTRVVNMNMKAKSEDQFEKSIRTENVAPFNDLGNNSIQLTDYYETDQLNNTKIKLNLLETGKVLDFNDQNVIILTVAPGDVTINMKIGGISNEAYRLKKRSEKAYRNMNRLRG